jgi:DNA-damage-inducible protein J
MNTRTISTRLDVETKAKFEKFCDGVGITPSTAFKMFAKNVVKKQRIPFDIEEDPFYSESNINYLSKMMDDYDSGKAVLETHDLYEV